jgi:hypothetical protein
MRIQGSVVQANTTARMGKAANPARDWSTPAAFCLAPGPGRHARHNQLRDHDQGGDDQRATFCMRERRGRERQHGRIGHLEQEQARGKDDKATVCPKAAPPAP